MVPCRAPRMNDASIENLPPPARRLTGWPWTAGGARVERVRDPPLVRLVTPSFQQASFLEATIRSVLLQEYPRLEYVVLDGGSRDGSIDVIRRYERWLTHWRSAPDEGQAAAIAEGLQGSDADVLGWVNSDDRLLPGALWRVAAARRAAPSAVAWVGSCRSVGPAGRSIYENAPRGLARDELADWGHAGGFGQPACFFSRAAWDRSGGLDRSLHFAFDVDLWLRLAALGSFVRVDGALAEETIHPDAKTHAQRGRSLAELHYVQLRHAFRDLALRRMAEELQDWDVLRRGTWAERLKHEANLALRPLLDRLGRRGG